MANEPFDLSQDDTHEARLRREAAATGIVDGRKLRKGSRNEQVAIKTTALKRSQLQRLALRAQKSQVEVIEEALDLYERELNKSSGKFGTSQWRVVENFQYSPDQMSAPIKTIGLMHVREAISSEGAAIKAIAANARFRG